MVRLYTSHITQGTLAEQDFCHGMCIKPELYPECSPTWPSCLQQAQLPFLKDHYYHHLLSTALLLVCLPCYEWKALLQLTVLQSWLVQTSSACRKLFGCQAVLDAACLALLFLPKCHLQNIRHEPADNAPMCQCPHDRAGKGFWQIWSCWQMQYTIVINIDICACINAELCLQANAAL